MIRRDICLYSLPAASVVAERLGTPRDGDTLLFPNRDAQLAFEREVTVECEAYRLAAKGLSGMMG